MGHHNIAKSNYHVFADRLNLFPQGAPESETLFAILRHLFTDYEAGLLAQVPLRPFSARKISGIWKLSEPECRKILEDLAKRALVMDMRDESDHQLFVLPPPIIGFIEFTLMRTRGDIDQKVLSELYHRYLVEEKEFVQDFFFSTQTRVTRTIVNEDTVTEENRTSILEYESALSLLKSSGNIGVSLCFCRHKARHLGHACQAPEEVCLTLGTTAQTLARHDHARLIDYSEASDIIALSRENNLVHIGENVQKHVSFICNCCGCCCELLQTAKQFGKFHPVETSNFEAQISSSICIRCGKCVKFCPIHAISQSSWEIPIIDKESCLGCGICAKVCPKKAVQMLSRPKRHVTPLNTSHRILWEAVEKGTLQHLIFDTKAYASHRALGTVLGVILKFPPVKAFLAAKQLHSVFLHKLISDKNSVR